MVLVCPSSQINAEGDGSINLKEVEALGGIIKDCSINGGPGTCSGVETVATQEEKTADLGDHSFCKWGVVDVFDILLVLSP